MKNVFQKIKNFFANFFTLNDSAHHIAGGVALGVFFGILPGEGGGTTLVAATLLKFNRAAATIGILSSNMWTTFLTLPLAVFIGGKLFGQSKKTLYEHFYQTYNLGWKYFLSKVIFFELALPLIVGYLIVSVVIALAFYLVIFVLLKYFKIQR